jgi:hypothetical protein
MNQKIRERTEVRKLRQRGLSLNQISEKIQASKSSVSLWVRDIELTQVQKDKLKFREIKGGIKGRRIIKFLRNKGLKDKYKPPINKPKERIVENFFVKWSADMAYVLGYFAADGSIYKNKNGSCYLSFTSIDKDLLLMVRKILNVRNKIETKKIRNINWKQSYVIQIGSKKMFNSLLDLGFTPNKSLTLKFPDIPNNMLPHFVRGYVDGDGCVSYRIFKRKDRGYRLYHSLSVRITSGSQFFLQHLRMKLIQSGIGNGYFIARKNENTFDLVYYGSDVLKLYQLLYPNKEVPCLTRKREVFENGLTSFKFWGRSSVG